ncbi:MULTISPECIES: MFS transporter [unclassified Lysinibacillus]|uniref:MFS transporter n=1 Tax=unclassified Lysinibacillus TaxID=2636778 RepID=UPI00381D4E4F
MNFFSNKNFRYLYSITILSSISATIYTFIIPLILYDLTKSAFAMSTMRVMEFLPNILLGMIIGVIVDRVNRNIMIIYGGFLKFLLSFLLYFSITTEGTAIWHLYVLGFLIATIGYTVGNALNALPPQLFEKSWMTEIQSKFSLILTISSIIGPSIVGALLFWLSYKHFLGIYVVCMALSWLISCFIDRTESPIRPIKQSIWKDMKDGIHELIGNKQVFIPTLTILISNFATSLIIGILTFYVIDILGATKEQLGLLYSISALGGIVGAKVLSPLRKHFNRGAIFATLPIIDMIVLILFFFTKSWWLIGILLAIRTCISVITNIIFLAIRQESTPNNLLGRVAGTSSMLMKLTIPAGLLLGGIWVEIWPVHYIFILSAIAMFINYILLKNSNFKEIK